VKYPWSINKEKLVIDRNKQPKPIFYCLPRGGR
jgi:hypothetical protein